MSAFKDSSGREWIVSLNAPLIKQVRSECKIDLADPAESFPALADDEVLLVDVLWVLCRSQAATRNMTDVAFGESLVGEAIAVAAEALEKATVDFFSGWKRSILRSLSEAQHARRKAISATLEANKAELTETIEEAVRKDYENAMTRLRSATNSPESWEFTSTDSRYGN